MNKLEIKLINLSGDSLFILWRFGILMIVPITGIAIITLSLLKLSTNLYTFITMFTLVLLLLYYLLVKGIDKTLIFLLMEQIDLDKYEAYWLKHIESKLGIKALAFHALGTVSFFRGNFERALDYFEQSRRSKGQTSKARQSFEDGRKEYITQINCFMNEKASDGINDFPILVGKNNHFDYLQAIVDVMYFKKPSLFFEQNEDSQRTKISQLMYTFYKAQNSLLLGNREEAQRLFSELSKENPQLFIVQEAKKKLSEL